MIKKCDIFLTAFSISLGSLNVTQNLGANYVTNIFVWQIIPTVGKKSSMELFIARKPNIAQMMDVTHVVELRAHLVAPSASQNCPL